MFNLFLTLDAIWRPEKAQIVNSRLSTITLYRTWFLQKFSIIPRKALFKFEDRNKVVKFLEIFYAFRKKR